MRALALVVVVVVAGGASVASSPGAPPCSDRAGDIACDGEHEVAGCEDPDSEDEIPSCLCADGFRRVDSQGCVSELDLDAACCNCLAAHTNAFDDPCSDAEQCTRALDNGGKISLAAECRQQCEGDCFFLTSAN